MIFHKVSVALFIAFVGKVDANDSGNVPIRIDIQSDNYPQEIAYTLSRGDQVLAQMDAFTIPHSSSGFGVNNPFHSQSVPGLQAGQEYQFQMTDVFGDGICCSHGIGRYEVFAETSDCGDVLLASGGAFFLEETKLFTVPPLTSNGGDCPTSTPTTSVQQIVPPPPPTTSFQQNVPPPNGPPSATPAPVPGFLPPTTPVSPPTMINDGGAVRLRVEVLGDSFPTEVGWSITRDSTVIVNKSTGYLMGQLPVPESGNTVSTDAIEGFREETSYQFKITDSFGDGICCSHGNGWYKVVAETTNCGDVVLAQGGVFTSEETKQLDIPLLALSAETTCAPTPAPVSVPSPPPPQPATASFPPCTICQNISDPDALVPGLGLVSDQPITCGELNEAGLGGLIDPGFCVFSQVLASSACGCPAPLPQTLPPLPPAATPYPTRSPTPAPIILPPSNTFVPSPLQPPVQIPVYPPCILCGGDGLENPDAVTAAVIFMGFQEPMKCFELVAFAEGGFLDPAFCPFIQGIASDDCGCPFPQTLSPLPPSVTPFPTPTPTPFPIIIAPSNRLLRGNIKKN